MPLRLGIVLFFVLSVADTSLAQRARETNTKTCACAPSVRISNLTPCSTFCARYKKGGSNRRGTSPGGGGLTNPNTHIQHNMGIIMQGINSLIPKGPSKKTLERQRKLKMKQRQKRLQQIEEDRRKQEDHDKMACEIDPESCLIGEGDLNSDLLDPEPVIEPVASRPSPSQGVSPDCLRSISEMETEVEELTKSFNDSRQKHMNDTVKSKFKDLAMGRLKSTPKGARAAKAKELYDKINGEKEKANACMEAYEALIDCYNICQRPLREPPGCMSDCRKKDQDCVDKMMPESLEEAQKGKNILERYAMGLTRAGMKGFKNATCIGK